MDTLKIPRHVAIILDGNGRWAKKRMLPRNAGHAKGSKTVEKIIEDAYDIGIKYLTLYAFSTENWNRPQDEVDALMKLLKDYLKTCLKRAEKNDLVVRVIGDKSRLDKDIQQRIKELEEFSAGNGGLNLTLAINYGGRDELTRAFKAMAEKISQGELDPKSIDEDTVSRFLDTAQIPDPDLMIRTSGEERLSNFLTWQLAYSEFYFTDVLWPDFTKEDLMDAIRAYSLRKRKFGKTEEQIEE